MKHLGEKDLHNISPIYRFCVEYCKLAELPFNFKVDSGNEETAIEFVTSLGNETVKAYHPPKSRYWRINGRVPDVLILNSLGIVGIIEYEEETGNRKSGAHYATKAHGHEGDYDTKKDTIRNEYYNRAGIRLLRIWESHYKKSSIWKLMLTEFLISCWRKQQTDSMTFFSEIPDLE